MNLMLHGIDNPHFKYTDALSKGYEERACYRLILANPPFKGSIDESDMANRFVTKTRKTELLFLQLIYELLEVGGRAAVIVPDGVLFDSSNAHIDVRKLLVDKCGLQGIVSMPSGVFKPYAGVNTAVLLFTKSGETKKVWFYNMQADGYSLDDKRQKIPANDIPAILHEWQRWTKDEANYATGDKNITLVDADVIRDNKYDLSISRYKAVEHQTVEYEQREAILDKLMAMEEEIAYVVKNIKNKLTPSPLSTETKTPLL